MATLMTSAEVAAHHGVKPFTVGRWVSAGYLTPVKTIGDGIRAARLFDAQDVHAFTPPSHRLDTGDILDWLDAAAKTSATGRRKDSRDALLQAIVLEARRTGGTFHMGQLDARLPEWAHGPETGAAITGLVRSGLIEHIPGQYAPRGDTRNRHGSTPCKVYRLIGAVA